MNKYQDGLKKLGGDTDEDYAVRFDAPKIVAKNRRCLRCEEKFTSEWSGERICSRCKKTSGWKNGVPATPTPSRARR